MTEVLMVFVTASGREEAERIATDVVVRCDFPVQLCTGLDIIRCAGTAVKQAPVQVVGQLENRGERKKSPPQQRRGGCAESADGVVLV